MVSLIISSLDATTYVLLVSKGNLEVQIVSRCWNIDLQDDEMLKKTEWLFLITRQLDLAGAPK